MSQVSAYIDGFNLYYGLRQKGWQRYYWFDPYLLVQSLLAPNDTLIAVKYFTAPVRADTPRQRQKRERQKTYLNALQAVSEAEIIQGKYLRKSVTCRSCRSSWFTYEEKMSDSAIASHVVADAFLGRFDTALLVGGDTDIVPAMKLVRRYHPKKQFEAWFPPARRNQDVEDASGSSGRMINGRHCIAAQMPERIQVAGGPVIERPSEWC